MLRHPLQMVVTTAVALAAMGVLPSFGQSATDLSLLPLKDADAADLLRRLPGCGAMVVDVADARRLAVLAQARWIMLRTSRGVLEVPVVFRDRGDKGPEIRFSFTDAALGGSMRGTLAETGPAQRCSMSSGCMEIPSHLRLTFASSASEARPVFDGAVIVVDDCATDARQRVFMTVSWWERLLRLISGH